MKLKLRKDLVIPAGTEISSDGMPTETKWGPYTVLHSIALGANATARVFVGAEVGDAEFDEWFEQVPDAPPPTKTRAVRH